MCLHHTSEIDLSHGDYSAGYMYARSFVKPVLGDALIAKLEAHGTVNRQYKTTYFGAISGGGLIENNELNHLSWC